MERNFVPEAWVGERVMVVRFDQQGASLPEERGWLMGVHDDGIVFARESFDDPLGELRPQKTKVYPWSTLALVTLLTDRGT